MGIALALAAIGFASAPAEAKTPEVSISQASTMSANALAPQWSNRDRWGRRNRRAQVFTQTRLVRRGRAVYRETYQFRYLPNGRTVSRLISRVRVR